MAKKAKKKVQGADATQVVQGALVEMDSGGQLVVGPSLPGELLVSGRLQFSNEDMVAAIAAGIENQLQLDVDNALAARDELQKSVDAKQEELTAKAAALTKANF